MSEQIVIWDKSKEHDELTQQFVDKRTIYAEKQNYPELVVEDVLSLFESELRCEGLYPSKVLEDKKQWYRDRLYAILLRRGVNKWLFVRKLLIRLKKKYQYRIRELQETLVSGSRQLSPKEYWKLRGELEICIEVRRELKLLCETPRWIIWNWKRVGLIDNCGMRKSAWRKWKTLYNELMNRRFER